MYQGMVLITLKQTNSKANQTSDELGLVVQVQSGAGVSSFQVPTPSAIQFQILTDNYSTAHTMALGLWALELCYYAPKYTVSSLFSLEILILQAPESQ